MQIDHKSLIGQQQLIRKKEKQINKMLKYFFFKLNMSKIAQKTAKFKRTNAQLLGKKKFEFIKFQATTTAADNNANMYKYLFVYLSINNIFPLFILAIRVFWVFCK